MNRSPTPLSAGTVKTLEHLVERIEANPGRLIDPGEMTEASEAIDVASVVAVLPDGLSREDFVDILRLAMLTECATETYADVFREGARRHDAPWLARFTDRTWVPDELTHAAPYTAMLRSLGFSEDELERDMKATQETHYDHCCGLTPVELTTYGMVQEQLTDQWHGLIAALVRPASPAAALMATRVKTRETLHTIWYREMTAIQVAADHDLLGPVSDVIMGFEMPGAQVAPEIQAKALRWMPHLGVDFTKVARDLVRNFSEVAGSTRGSGELLANVAARRGYSVGPLPLRMVRAILARFGGFGYEILGEAIRERVGLPFESPVSNTGRARPFVLRRALKGMRGAVRSSVAQRIDLRAVTGETSPAQ